ncbi:MAG: NUDIX domain-containing protein [Mariprofundaceae bacterium]|nr:NUDIX domain-containing protein [Mariprofundaceae bacterium]
MKKIYTLSKTSLYQGFFKLDHYHVCHDTFAGGQLQVQREHLERGDAAAIVLFDKARDEVLLLEQFRIGPAVRQEPAWLIEVVAGMIDQGETAQQAARREAIEEVGYEPTEIKHLGCYYTTPGGSSEKLDLFLGLVDRAKPVHAGGGMLAEGEDIRHFWLSRTETMLWVQQGKINSGGPMLALLLAFGSTGLAYQID